MIVSFWWQYLLSYWWQYPLSQEWEWHHNGRRVKCKAHHWQIKAIIFLQFASGKVPDAVQLIYFFSSHEKNETQKVLKFSSCHLKVRLEPVTISFQFSYKSETHFLCPWLEEWANFHSSFFFYWSWAGQVHHCCCQGRLHAPVTKTAANHCSSWQMEEVHVISCVCLLKYMYLFDVFLHQKIVFSFHRSAHGTHRVAWTWRTIRRGRQPMCLILCLIAL